jgi:hypothetical protein
LAQVSEESCESRLEPLVWKLGSLQLTFHPIVHGGGSVKKAFVD